MDLEPPITLFRVMAVCWWCESVVERGGDVVERVVVGAGVMD